MKFPRPKTRLSFMLGFLVCLLFIVGCVGTRVSNPVLPVRSNHYDIRVMMLSVDGFNESMDWWTAEVMSEYSDALIVVTHGNTGPDGEWWAYNDLGERPMEDLIRSIRQYQPHIRIVLIACNPDGLEFDMPNVTYATANVWIWPDDSLTPAANEQRDWYDPDAAGDLDDFTENPTF